MRSNFGDHRPHAEQVGALGRPVARRARAVFRARHHHQRHAFGPVALGGIEDRHRLALRIVQGALPSTPGVISFCTRMLAKVPRIITSWFSRRAA